MVDKHMVDNIYAYDTFCTLRRRSSKKAANVITTKKSLPRRFFVKKQWARRFYTIGTKQMNTPGFLRVLQIVLITTKILHYSTALWEIKPLTGFYRGPKKIFDPPPSPG